MALDAPRTLELAVHGPIALSDLPGLCARVQMRLSATDAELVVCDLRDVQPDAVAVDALARLELAARRHQSVLRLRNASPALLDLVAFMGLADVLAADPGAGRGQASPGSDPTVPGTNGSRARHRVVDR